MATAGKPSITNAQAGAGAAAAPRTSVSTVSSLESVQLNEWQKVIEYDSRFEAGEFAIAEFASLQRYNLVQIQNQLAKMKVWIARQNGAAAGAEEQGNNHVLPLDPAVQALQDTLHHYANAIRDFVYLAQFEKTGNPARRASLQEIFADIAVQDDFHPFTTNFITPHRDTQRNEDTIREFLRRRLPLSLSWGPAEREKRGKWFSRRQRPEEYSPFVDRVARFLIALLVGASLVVPMVVMSVDHSKTKSLVTTSVAVVLFAVVVSFGLRIGNKDTVTATAAYAAVLVVFVGTSGSGS